jgi:hypothetical protein
MMTESIGISSSTISFARFFGQVVQGVIFLHDFLGNIQEAPKEIEALNKHLKQVGTIINDVQTHGDDTLTLRQAVGYCGSWVIKLRNMIERYNPACERSKMRVLTRFIACGVEIKLEVGIISQIVLAF